LSEPDGPLTHKPDTPDPAEQRYLRHTPTLVLPDGASPARQPSSVRLQIVKAGNS